MQAVLAISGSEDEKTSVMLFLPTEKDKAEAENAIREILGTASGIEPEVYPQIENRDTNSHSTANPYILLAYSTCGTNDIDKIASLDYYTDGELLEVMKSVEDPRGVTIFSGGENGGLGYVDPLYVRNDVIREMHGTPRRTDKWKLSTHSVRLKRCSMRCSPETTKRVANWGGFRRNCRESVG